MKVELSHNFALNTITANLLPTNSFAADQFCFPVSLALEVARNMRSHIFRRSIRRPPIFGAEHYKIKSFCEELLVIFGYFCCVLSVRRAGLHCKVNVAGLSESASDFSDFVFRLFSPPPPLEFLHILRLRCFFRSDFYIFA